MSTTLPIWHLKLHDRLIATIQADAFEFPWTHGHLIDSSEFERFRDYFSDDAHWPDTQAFDDLCAEIQALGRFTLINGQSGEVFHNVTLHQDGNTVWFRVS